MSFGIPFIGSLYSEESGTFDTSFDNHFQTREVKLNDLQLEIILKLKEADVFYKNHHGYTHVVVEINLDVRRDDQVLNCSIMLDETGVNTGRLYLGDNVTIGEFTFKYITVTPFDHFTKYVVSKDLISKKNDDEAGFVTSEQTFIDEVERFINNPDCCYLSQADISHLSKCVDLPQATKFSLFVILNNIKTEVWLNSFKHVITNVISFKTNVNSYKLSYNEIETDFIERIHLVQNMLHNNVLFVESTKSLIEILEDRNLQFYILFFSLKQNKLDRRQFYSAFKFFHQLHDRKQNNINIKFVVVDTDLHQQLPISPPDYVTVAFYKNGKWISEDVCREMNNPHGNDQTCYAKCSADKRKSGKPTRRTIFNVPCPSCNNEPVQWFCCDCNCLLQFGFDDYLYCNCGKCLLKFYTFKCGEWDHGSEYATPDSRYYKCTQTLKPMKEVNLLIVGASGVGKSTWINSIVNYTRFETLDEASNNDILFTIPTRFVLTNDDYEPTTIQVGYDDNENVEIGQSATQKCRTYSVSHNDMFINLIDTPGIGDVRGVAIDKVHVKNILDYISYKPTLNGICILLKPNDKNLTALFKYCVKEILTHLHKDAARNILFCFTNTRQTNYKPGETMPALEVLLQEIGIYYLLEKNRYKRIYCLDNEAFRFLCALSSKSVKFTADERRTYEESWNRSVKETRRMLNFVNSLDPHNVDNTTTLNQARLTILSLTKPMAEITRNIETNIAELNNKKTVIETWAKNEQELQKNLFLNQTTITATNLDNPMTVCTSQKCVKHYSLEGVGKTETEYVTQCCVDCHLTNVVPERLHEPEIRNCSVMSNEYCNNCSCHWSTHIHFKYTLERRVTKITDESVESKLLQHMAVRQNRENALKMLEIRLRQLENEKKVIIHTSAQFGNFLKMNAITPYNDSMDDYIEYLVELESDRPDKTVIDRAVKRQLKQTRVVYKEEVKVIDEAMKSDTDVILTPEDVVKLQQNLYKLPINGEQLKKVMGVAVVAQKNYSAHGDKTLGTQSTGAKVSKTQTKSSGPSSGAGGGSGTTARTVREIDDVVGMPWKIVSGVNEGVNTSSKPVSGVNEGVNTSSKTGSRLSERYYKPPKIESEVSERYHTPPRIVSGVSERYYTPPRIVSGASEKYYTPQRIVSEGYGRNNRGRGGRGRETGWDRNWRNDSSDDGTWRNNSSR